MSSLEALADTDRSVGSSVNHKTSDQINEELADCELSLTCCSGDAC